MKKFLCLLLALVLCLPFAACGDNEESSSKEPEPVYPTSLTIGGVPLSEYKIIYADSRDCPKYKTAAESLAAYFKERFGVTVDVIYDDDDDYKVQPNEILFGACEWRSECEDYAYNMFEFGEYQIDLVANRLLFIAADACSAYKGVKAFIEKVDSDPSGVYNEARISGKDDKIIKVACVGDSITQGINSSAPLDNNYPAFLNAMLGLDYYVLNAGHSGYSTCKTDEYAYCKSQYYKQTIEFKPDVMIYNLGTNDANPGQPYKNWDDHDRQGEFMESAHELIDTIVASNPEMQVYICIPTSLFKVENDRWDADNWNKNLVAHSIPCVKQLIEDYGYPSINLYDWSLEHPELFPDGLHPKDLGYKDYAAVIYDGIKDTIVKPQ